MSALLVGSDKRGQVHAARVGQRDNSWTAICQAPVLALAMLDDIHQHTASDGDLCKRCAAMIRASRDEGAQCGD